jgi:hypothetical protein
MCTVIDHIADLMSDQQPENDTSDMPALVDEPEDALRKPIPLSERNVAWEDEQIAALNADANEIFVDCKKRIEEDKQFAKLDHGGRYEYYMKLRPDFARAYPTILSYLVCGMYSTKANWLYLKQCYQFPVRPTHQGEDWAGLQADFIMYIHKCCTTIRGEELKKLREDNLVAIMADLTTQAKEKAIVQAERDAAKAEVLEARRAAMRKMAESGRLAEVVAALAQN